MSSFLTFLLVNVVGRVGIEVVSATRRTAKCLANLVLGAQMVNQPLLLGEDIETHLADELKAQRHNTYYPHAMHNYVQDSVYMYIFFYFAAK